MPYEDDWMDLISYLGNANVAGGIMKDTSLQYWKLPNLSATNESGFSELPGGQRNSNGSFEYVTEIGVGGVLKMYMKITPILDLYFTIKKLH